MYSEPTYGNNYICPNIGNRLGEFVLILVFVDFLMVEYYFLEFYFRFSCFYLLVIIYIY